MENQNIVEEKGTTAVVEQKENFDIEKNQKYIELSAKVAEFEKKELERIENEKKKQQAEAEKRGEFEKLFSETRAEKEKIEQNFKELSAKVAEFEKEKEERRLNLLNKLDKDDQEIFKNLDEKQLQKLIEKQSPNGNSMVQSFKLDPSGNNDKDEIQNLVVKAKKTNNPLDLLNLRNSLISKFEN